MRILRHLFVVAVLAAELRNVGVAAEPVYTVGGQVKVPVKIKDCRAHFPPDVRGKRIAQPFFLYECVISKSGSIEQLRLVKGPHGDLYDSIERSFRKSIECWRFRPGTLNGRAVAVRFHITASAEVR